MTKKTVLALAVALTVSGAGISQETDSTKLRKNEVGLNIVPIAVALMGGESSRPTFSISYKRIVKEKNALRLSASYQLRSYNGYPLDNYGIIYQTDSTQLRRNYEYNNGDKIQGNFGYEWRKGKKKLKYFYGADLILGNTNNSFRIYDEHYKLGKKIQSQTNSGIDTLPQLILDSSATVKFTKTNYYYIGTSPFFGFYYLFGKKISLSFQTGFDLSFSSGKMETKDYVKNETSETRISTFDFNMDGLVNNLSIIYRF